MQRPKQTVDLVEAYFGNGPGPGLVWLRPRPSSNSGSRVDPDLGLTWTGSVTKPASNRCTAILSRRQFREQPASISSNRELAKVW